MDNKPNGGDFQIGASSSGKSSSGLFERYRAGKRNPSLLILDRIAPALGTGLEELVKKAITFPVADHIAAGQHLG
jgi:transcriptional regulator with XRE-family HTH domain